MKLTPELLLRAYAIGVFPMADDADAPDVYWVEPKRRAILPLDGFYLSTSLRKTVRSDHFRVTLNRDFDAIVALCAESAADRPSTWINADIRSAYAMLHHIGHAHSVECRDASGAIVGGLYGVSLGRAFFGESMVSRATDASKVALAHLVARMRFAGFALLDCQFMTPHLKSMGAIDISKKTYQARLSAAVEPPDQFALGAGAVALGADGAAFAGATGALGAPPAFGPVFGRLSAPFVTGAVAGVAGPDLGALDAVLSDPAGLAAAGFTGGGSPGYVIAQLLTNTS